MKHFLIILAAALLLAGCSDEGFLGIGAADHGQDNPFILEIRSNTTWIIMFAGDRYNSILGEEDEYVDLHDGFRNAVIKNLEPRGHITIYSWRDRRVGRTDSMTTYEPYGILPVSER